jgi:2-amino-4-hydroxy-6-hydroxymethyldihydropteridine diphosphokinase
MARIYISIGSNIKPEQNIRKSITELKQVFNPILISSVYESEAVGFDGDNFYNLVVACDTDKDIFTVIRILQDLENRHGRDRSRPRFSSRTLDLDLLLYDDVVVAEGKLQLPRDEITKNAFVLWPLAEIAPDVKHPVTSVSFNEMWQNFDKSQQAIWPVEFDWE